MPTITTAEVDIFRKYIADLCGIQLDASKAYLLESRLTPLLREYQCHNFQELYHKATRDASRRLAQKIIDAISTKETSFFRDQAPFILLREKLLPEFLARPSPPGQAPALRIWSAACSTGQEVYSIAITLKEYPVDLAHYRVAILGTDISDAALLQARAGCYNRVEIERGFPPDKRHRYFVSDGSSWRIRDEIRAMVSFRRLNLLEPFVGLGTFDIIFCRNVAIYFSLEDRRQLFERLADQLHPQGTLILGATETLLGAGHRYERKQYQHIVYYQVRS